MNFRSEFRLKAEPDRFFRFERVMLSGGCRYFIPMRFFEEDGSLLVQYNCSGFSPLSRYRIERTEDVLYILEKTALIMQHSAEYLIDPRRIALSTKTVFYNHEDGDIRIAFVPLKRPREEPAEAVSVFIKELSRDLEDGGLPLLERLRRNIIGNNLNAEGIIRQIGLVRQETHGLRTSGPGRAAAVSAGCADHQ